MSTTDAAATLPHTSVIKVTFSQLYYDFERKVHVLIKEGASLQSTKCCRLLAVLRENAQVICACRATPSWVNLFTVYTMDIRELTPTIFLPLLATREAHSTPKPRLLSLLRVHSHYAGPWTDRSAKLQCCRNQRVSFMGWLSPALFFFIPKRNWKKKNHLANFEVDLFRNGNSLTLFAFYTNNEETNKGGKF